MTQRYGATSRPLSCGSVHTRHQQYILVDKQQPMKCNVAWIRNRHILVVVFHSREAWVFRAVFVLQTCGCIYLCVVLQPWRVIVECAV